MRAFQALTDSFDEMSGGGIQWSGMRSVLIADSPYFSPLGLMLPSSPQSWRAIALADPGSLQADPTPVR
jgi:hypothetical protein